MEEEYQQSWFAKFKSFIGECKRVLIVTKKPTSLEFKTIVKAAGLGMIIIGLIGFIIQVLTRWLFY